MSSSPSVTAPSSMQAIPSKMEKVSQDSLERELTANDLIGEDVLGSDGESLGEIVDISVASSSHLAEDSMSSRSGMSADRSGATSASRTTESRPNTGMETAGTTGANRTSQSGSMAGARTDRDSVAGDNLSGDRQQATRESQQQGTRVAGTSQRSDSQAWSSSTARAQSSSDEASVIISSGGGIFGEESLVKVPLSELSRNSDGELTLNVAKEQFDSVAKGETERSSSQYGAVRE